MMLYASFAIAFHFLFNLLFSLITMSIQFVVAEIAHSSPLSVFNFLSWPLFNLKSIFFGYLKLEITSFHNHVFRSCLILLLNHGFSCVPDCSLLIFAFAIVSYILS